jgi:hypothetical protein
MKKILILLAVALIGFSTSRCSFGDFGDTNVDPNNPSQYDVRFMYVFAVRNALPSFYITGTYDPWTLIYCQYISEKNNIQFTAMSSTTYAIGGYYTSAIKNLNAIIKFNTDEASKNTDYVLSFGSSNANQIAVARTLKAYIFMHLTDVLGMITYSEALQGQEGNFKPKYDDQQSIYTDLNKELEEAYAQFDVSSPLNSTYEILYNGDINKWKKFNASVRMQLAIKLFKADEAAGKTRFAKAYADGFIRSNADIFQYKYLSESANQNPLYDNMVVSARRDFQPSGTLIDTLLKYNDPRLDVYASPNKYDTYWGMPFGLTRDQAAAISSDTISPFNTTYYKQNSPAVLVTPSVILLAAAEAAERQWISASAEALYNEAVTAALNQHGLDSDVAAYLAQPKVKYKTTGTQADRLYQIAMQKWLASYLQDSFEAYSDWRRLGIPNLKPGPSATTISAIPRRRMYHTDDYNANKVNYDAAVAAQGADAVSTRVWWDKP